MPYIEIVTNLPLTKEKETAIKSGAARILADSFPGKTENWLMVSFEPETGMFFAGSDAPCLMASVALFGRQSDLSYDRMTAGLTRFLEEETGVPADRIYIRYEEFEHWGWNGSNF